MDHLSKTYNVSTPGIARAVTNPRFKSLGWEEYAKYRDPTDRETPSGTTPGSAAMGSPPPTSTDTGEARRKKRKAPDVGKE